MNKKFTVYSKSGEKGYLIIDSLNYNGVVYKIKVKELKIKSNIVKSDEEATIVFLFNGKVALQFSDMKMLDTTKHRRLIDFIWENGESNVFSTLYPYTTNYNANFED